jgi:hypothetical protein
MRKDPEQKTLLLFILKNPAGINAGMTTFYSQQIQGMHSPVKINPAAIKYKVFT